MLDRASTFADPAIVQLLQTEFVPVALDQAYQRRQEDTEGKFYRKIASQGPRSDFRATTQGFYIATASGDLLLYNNNRDPEKVRRLLQERLLKFKKQSKRQARLLSTGETDSRYTPTRPDDAMVARVHGKILSGYEPTTDRWRKIFQSALSRDNLWISKSEQDALVAGDFSESLAVRIARFHLIDSTRGEPVMWRPSEVRIEVKLSGGVVTGTAEMETANGRRGYSADLRGVIEAKEGRLHRFDLVAKGLFWGDGPYTKRAPDGKFPLAISFELADGSDVADEVLPQGIKGWRGDYINSK